MNFRKSVLSLALAAIFSVSAIASTTVSSEEFKPTSKAQKEISTLIQKINFNLEVIKESTVKVKFMVNENNQVIVLSTGESSVDATLKHGLNYKKIDADNLEAYKVYIVPVTFKKIV